jgi:hypothetical protein
VGGQGSGGVGGGFADDPAGTAVVSCLSDRLKSLTRPCSEQDNLGVGRITESTEMKEVKGAMMTSKSEVELRRG